MNLIHEVKINPDHFQDVIKQTKKAEIRRNDRHTIDSANVAVHLTPIHWKKLNRILMWRGNHMKLNQFRALKVGDKVSYGMWHNLTFRGTKKGKVIIADRSEAIREVPQASFLIEGQVG